MFTMEWPPGSGRQMEFPEIDRVDFFDVTAAKRKIKASQVGLIKELEEIVKGKPSSEGVQTSEQFQAILGCLLGENWSTPRLVEMVITPDGHVLGRCEG